METKKQLEITENEAREIYPNASNEFKKVLESTFGKNFFLGKITDRIQTWQNVLDYHFIKNENEVIGFVNPKNKKQRVSRAVDMMQLISETLNEGHKFDFGNNEKKYYAYFIKETGVWGLIDSNYFCDRSSSCVGSGFHFVSPELINHSWKYFKEIWLDYLPE